ncbi:MAG: LCP family protein [Candidatus Rokubacteria bacterium]|nr:LCP family protein [Candidatus Rokubacteria bacterium]
MDDLVRIFDTTLRDGEQSPGFSMTSAEKLELARQLEALRVDVIEAGFPASSPGDLESVRAVAREIREAAVAALARANPKDVDAAVEALDPAARPRVHVFIATSPIHMEHKLRMTPDDAVAAATAAVARARRFTDDSYAFAMELLLETRVAVTPGIDFGSGAEGYIRFRHDALGDIGRVERQQKILLAIFRKLKNPAMLVRAPQLIRAFTDNTQTNLTLPEIMSLGMFALRLEEADIQVATLPGTFAPSFWEPDWSRARPLVVDYFHGVSPQVLAATTIELLNASGVPGLARRTAGRPARAHRPAGTRRPLGRCAAGLDRRRAPAVGSRARAHQAPEDDLSRAAHRRHPARRERRRAHRGTALRVHVPHGEPEPSGEPRGGRARALGRPGAAAAIPLPAVRGPGRGDDPCDAAPRAAGGAGGRPVGRRRRVPGAGSAALRRTDRRRPVVRVAAGRRGPGGSFPCAWVTSTR